MITHVVENKSLHLGDNLYAAGTLSIPASTKYKAGAVLKRSGEGFAVAAPPVGEDDDVAVAVLGFDAENTTAGPVSKNVSAIIWGRVRHDMVYYASAPSAPLTAAQCDALRAYGIVALKVTDVSRLDNQ
jgi:hypothetical protein